MGVCLNGTHPRLALLSQSLTELSTSNYFLRRLASMLPKYYAGHPSDWRVRCR